MSTSNAVKTERNNAMITFYVKPSEKDQLERLAESEDRTMSKLAALVMRRFLKENRDRLAQK